MKNQVFTGLSCNWEPFPPRSDYPELIAAVLIVCGSVLQTVRKEMQILSFKMCLLERGPGENL